MRALHDRPHRLGERAGVVERRSELAEIEVALVDPRLLDRRDHLAHDRPDLARVLAVERAARPHEHGLRAAAERLGARHRRDDPELPGHVVRGRDHAAAVRVAADDERLPAELGALELLDGGEECVEVEVRDDHATRVDPRLDEIVCDAVRERDGVVGAGRGAPTLARRRVARRQRPHVAVEPLGVRAKARRRSRRGGRRVPPRPTARSRSGRSSRRPCRSRSCRCGCGTRRRRRGRRRGRAAPAPAPRSGGPARRRGSS